MELSNTSFFSNFEKNFSNFKKKIKKKMFFHKINYLWCFSLRLIQKAKKKKRKKMFFLSNEVFGEKSEVFSFLSKITKKLHFLDLQLLFFFSKFFHYFFSI